MVFELNQALIDELSYCMEDQNGTCFLDTRDLIVIKCENREAEMRDPERFVRIPDWGPADGFLLMKKFVASLKNPAAHEILTKSLKIGKGVFRAFKDALEAYPQAEKLWFAFKRREMKRCIFQWYNSLRESWNLEKIGFEEPEETEELVLEDFVFRNYKAEDKDTMFSMFTSYFEEDPDYERLVFNSELDTILVAEAAERGLAGFALIRKEEKGYHLFVYVKPEYRGLGLGSELCCRVLACNKDYKEIYIDVKSSMKGFTRFLLRSSFAMAYTRYVLKR